MEAPRQHNGSFFKVPRTAAKLARHRERQERKTAEKTKKGEVRKRDKFCRFPMCGCRRLHLALKARPEVSHDKHKGIGGNPTGDRSEPELMIYLCLHRHQDAIFSRHKGTLRQRYLTERKNAGPVAWDLDRAEALRWFADVLPLAIGINGTGDWIEIARETHVQQLADVLPWQQIILRELASMEL